VYAVMAERKRMVYMEGLPQVSRLNQIVPSTSVLVYCTFASKA